MFYFPLENATNQIIFLLFKTGQGKVLARNYTPRCQDVWGSGGVATHILNFNAKCGWGCVQLHYPAALLSGEEPRCVLGGPQGPAGR
jgi:hypothetical protein